MTRRVVVFLFAFGLTALAARPEPAGAPSPSSGPVTDPAVVRQHYEQVLAQPQFREPEEPAGDFPIRDWLSQWLTHLVSEFQDFKYAGRMSGLAWLLVTAMTALAIVGLLYVLVRLSRRSSGPVPDDDAALPGRKMFLSPRLYDERLRRAIEQRDWRRAWLATWLQFLSRLEDRRMVEADRSRTNREYLAQLRAQHLPASALPLITGLVEDYDRFIYGLRPIDEPVWRAFRREIDEVSLLLHLRDRTPASPTAEEPA